MGVQWEVIGGQRKVSGQSWESMRGSWRSVGGQGVVIGDHSEVICSLSKAMGRSESVLQMLLASAIFFLKCLIHWGRNTIFWMLMR